MEASRFDVFLSHHSADKADVEGIAERLRQAGIEPWLDRWQYRQYRQYGQYSGQAASACAQWICADSAPLASSWLNSASRRLATSMVSQI